MATLSLVGIATKLTGACQWERSHFIPSAKACCKLCMTINHQASLANRRPRTRPWLTFSCHYLELVLTTDILAAYGRAAIACIEQESHGMAEFDAVISASLEKCCNSTAVQHYQNVATVRYYLLDPGNVSAYFVVVITYVSHIHRRFCH
ncbi:hypothetical protein EV356DRAFT_107349 [Viridothelium virens]|uniref:Uncharacterized protein n=1 Tax=Viridothelium virens TaxID=1048519 RepID=A0A6A6HNR4_VIRVR|nr:hypothetical protein EV356DRAFT_107349 [Viridothelium virens]